MEMSGKSKAEVGDITALTMEEINSLSSIGVGLSLMEKYGLCTSGLERLQDVKDSLVDYYWSTKEDGHSVRKLQSQFQRIITEEKEKSEAFHNILDTIQDKMKGLDEQIVAHLKREGLIKNGLAEDIKEMGGGHGTDEYIILVTGSTSTDIAFLINCLLGYNVVPATQNASEETGETAYKIRYGPDIKVKVKEHPEGSWREKRIDKQANALEIGEFVFNQGTSGIEHVVFREVEIFLPAKILQTGIQIVGVPCIKDNQDPDNIHKFLGSIKTGAICSLLYLVKLEDAENCQNRKIQGFLDMLQTYDKKGPNAFHKLPLICICCHSEEQSNSSLESAKNTFHSNISKAFPFVQKRDIHTLSTSQCLNMESSPIRHFVYTGSDLNHVTDAILFHFKNHVKSKLKYAYSWAQHLLARSIHHASVFLLRTRLSSQELQARCENVISRLGKIERESDSIIKTLDDKLHSSIAEITEKLANYLKSENAQNKMGAWQLQQLPSARSFDQWDDIEAKIDVAIENRLHSVVSDWNKKGNHFQNAQTELQTMFKKEFFILEHELENVDNLIQNESYSTTENVEEHGNLHSFTDMFDPAGGAFDFNFSMFQKLALGLVAPVLLPIALGVFVGTPTTFMWDFKKWMKQANAKRNLFTYRQDPVSFTHARSMQFAQRISDYDVINDYVATQMKPLKQHLETMREAIPRIIQLNRDLIGSLTDDKRSKAELERLYLSLEQEVPLLQEEVAAFGNMHVQNHLCSKEDIEVVTEKAIFGNRKTASGIWATVSKANIRDTGDLGTKSFTIKEYKRKVPHFHLNREETNMRISRHPYICQLIGTFESEKGIPGFILDSHLNRARQELFGFKALPKSSEGRKALMKRCCNILEQVGIGLEYLHYKGLVHMELSLDTVMIVANKDLVKLSNIGEPRKAELPDMDTDTLDCVYLAPEVLQGNVYKPQSDIYSLGLMAWELWNQERVYKDYRKQKLADFIDKVTTDSVELTVDPINPLNDLIAACLGEELERIGITAWVDQIKGVIGVLNANAEKA